MATITKITAAEYLGEGQPIRAIQTKQHNYYLHHVRQAYADGKFRRELAGPGWGDHNALLIPIQQGIEVLNDVHEPWWGTWLATIEEDAP